MTKLVSLTQASEHLRRDTTDDDADLDLKIEAASEVVLNYLKDSPAVTFINTDGEVEEDTAGNPVGVPRAIQIAVLMLVGIFYRDREGQSGNSTTRASASDWQTGYLPPAITAVLYPLRKPEVL